MLLLIPIGIIFILLLLFTFITYKIMSAHLKKSEYVGFKWWRKTNLIINSAFKKISKRINPLFQKIWKKIIVSLKWLKKYFILFIKIIFSPIFLIWRIIVKIKWIWSNVNISRWKRFKLLIKKLFSKKHSKKNVIAALMDGSEINENYDLMKSLNYYEWDEVIISDLTLLYKIFNENMKKELKKAKIELISVLEKWLDHNINHNLEINKDYIIKSFNEKNKFFHYLKIKLLTSESMPIFKNVNIVKNNIGYRLELIKNEHIWTK